MSDELILPVFPLPEVILFPRTMLPLHIFEKRYRKLVKDLLNRPESERLMVITTMTDASNKGEEDFERIATVGRLVHHEPLPDGRSNIVIQGQFTVKIEEIEPSPNSYRMCRIVSIREEFWMDPLQDRDEQHKKLMDAIHKFMDRTNSRIENLDVVGIDDLINGLAFSLNIETIDKQELLEEQTLDKRLDLLIYILDQIGYYTNYIPDEQEYTDIN